MSPASNNPRLSLLQRRATRDRTRGAGVGRFILLINSDSRPRALQVALLIPILAGFLNSFRMVRLPEVVPAGSAEATVLV